MKKTICVVLTFLCVIFVTAQEYSSDTLTLIDGLYPDYGTHFNDTMQSISPECPEDSIGIYPDCKCTTGNFDYSVRINECFRVCPDDSTGYWPNCKCNGEFGFDKENFECKQCPPGNVSGIYPKCVCNDENIVFNPDKNQCETCPIDSSGKIPNCICDNGSGKINIYYLTNLTNQLNLLGFLEYMAKRNKCKKCPIGLTGSYPNCICSDGGKFDGEYCRYCPWNSYGTVGECICNGNRTYIKEKNQCLECPWRRLVYSVVNWG